MRARIVKEARRVVIKVGTSVITTPAGRISTRAISSLSDEIVRLCRRRREIVLVTSGAIAAGLSRMRISERPKSLPQLQAAAAVGQGHLMHLYAREFGKRGLEVAQMLLTADGLKERGRHLNARNTINALLARRVIPIINENDSVATDEIKFGDNDILSALVANLVRADLLIILTDAPGLMTRDPREGRGILLGDVHSISHEIEALGRGAGSTRGTGGMASKIRAARMVVTSGEAVVIADGRAKNILQNIFRGEEIGTFFHPAGGRMKGRKRWIAFFVKPKGRITVDAGAASALIEKGRSLLAIGVGDVRGDFIQGDTVSVLDERGREIARGLTNYTAAEMRAIKGKRTSEIRAALGYRDYDEVIHRDNLVLLVGEGREADS